MPRAKKEDPVLYKALATSASQAICDVAAKAAKQAAAFVLEKVAALGDAGGSCDGSVEAARLGFILAFDHYEGLVVLQDASEARIAELEEKKQIR